MSQAPSTYTDTVDFVMLYILSYRAYLYFSPQYLTIVTGQYQDWIKPLYCFERLDKINAWDQWVKSHLE